jgi:hypothetical protein
MAHVHYVHNVMCYMWKLRREIPVNSRDVHTIKVTRDINGILLSSNSASMSVGISPSTRKSTREVKNLVPVAANDLLVPYGSTTGS